MDKSHQKILQENHEVIAREIVQDNKTDDVIYELTDKDVFTTQFRDQLLKEETTKTNKIRRIVQNLQYLGPNAFRSFLEVLVQLDLYKLAYKLDPALTDQFSNHISVQNDVLDNLQRMPYINPLVARSSSKDDELLPLPTLPNMTRRRSHHKIDPITGQTLGITLGIPVDVTPPMGPLTINVTPAEEIYGIEKDSTDLYKNVSMPRGLVFMANYKDFANNQHKSRNGSEMDVKNLTLLFTQMGYKFPKHHINMTRNETVKAIREFTRNPEMKEVDSCIVIIMSHGRDEKSFYTSDNHYLPINEVVEKFSNSECPALKGKPKIFIFQYCRGPLEDIGVSNQVRQVVNRLPQTQGGIQVETDASNFGEAGVIRDATYTDMFIIYSTVEGYVSFRHPERGSWLIEAICDIFMKNAYDMDLDALMKKVSQMVRKNYTDHGTKQVCEIVSRAFDRHFYFNPIQLQDTCSMNMGALTRVLSESACSLEGAVSNGPISPRGIPYSPGMTPPPHTRRFKPVSLENLHNISRGGTPEPQDPLHNSHRSRRRNYSGNSNHSEMSLNDSEGDVVLRHPQVSNLSGKKRHISENRRRSMSPNSRLNAYQHQLPKPLWGRTISEPANGSREGTPEPRDGNVFIDNWQTNRIIEEINQSYVEESFDIVDSPMASLEPVTDSKETDTVRIKAQATPLPQNSQSFVLPRAASEGEEEDEIQGLKRQLSSPSTQETLFKINDIKRYMQVNDADEQYMHGLSRVESFLKKMKNIGKKRKKDNEASSLEF